MDYISSLGGDRSLFEGTFLEFLGIRLVQVREGFVRMEIDIDKVHSNTLGMTHGGIIMSMLDIVSSFCAHGGKIEEQVAVTMTQSTNFVRAHRGALLVGEATLTNATTRTAFTQARVLDPSLSENADEQVCATAQCSFRLVNR